MATSNVAPKNDVQSKVLDAMKQQPQAQPDMQSILLAELARLKAENERLRAAKTPDLTLKVSEKGAVSVYGLGKFPFTLYREQWLRLLAIADKIKAFIQANDTVLARKGDSTATA